MKGFPAAEQTLEDLRPLLAQLDPGDRPARRPRSTSSALNKRELTSFFANTVAATQAKDPGTQLHYLRTSNPLNPENLAVYPHRLPTNRPNPYRLPGGFDELPTGPAGLRGPPVQRGEPDPDGHQHAADVVNDVVDAVPTAVPTIVGGACRCRRSRCRRSRRCRSRPSRRRR